MLNPTNTTSEPAFSLDTVTDKRIFNRTRFIVKLTGF
jgi:hypothetical protein